MLTPFFLDPAAKTDLQEATQTGISQKKERKIACLLPIKTSEFMGLRGSMHQIQLVTERSCISDSKVYHYTLHRGLLIHHPPPPKKKNKYKYLHAQWPIFISFLVTVVNLCAYRYFLWAQSNQPLTTCHLRDRGEWLMYM